MKLKNKGRKIYKTKEKNYYGKSPVGKFLSGALTVLLIGGIGFLGYSIAEPIVNYTKKRGDNDTVISESDTQPNSEASEMTTAAVITIPENNNIQVYKAASLNASDLENIEKLNGALQNINKNVGYEYISVPLKVSGGDICYASAVPEAQLCGAVKYSLTLSEITSAVRAAGFKPIAEVSLLRDNIAPLTYPDMAYTTSDDGSRWIDNSAESGGKHWISPFTDKAVTYLTNIIDEIAAADFDGAMCSDVVFPPFRESDLAVLGEEVSGEENYLALTSLVNTMYSRLLNGGKIMMLEVSGVDLLQENYDVMQPMLLDVNTVVLNVDLDAMGNSVSAGGTVYEFAGTASENVSKLIGLVQYKLEGYNVVVRISGGNTDVNELIKAKDVINDYGYTSFMIG